MGGSGNHVRRELSINPFLDAELLGRKLIGDAPRASEFELIVVILDARLSLAPTARTGFDIRSRLQKLLFD